jgi:hypothetical protein
VQTGELKDIVGVPTSKVGIMFSWSPEDIMLVLVGEIQGCFAMDFLQHGLGLATLLLQREYISAGVDFTRPSIRDYLDICRALS